MEEVAGVRLGGLNNLLFDSRYKEIMALSNEPDDPTDFKDHIRDEAAKRFIPLKRTQVKYDTEQLIREIRALLKINAEIFTLVWIMLLMTILLYILQHSQGLLLTK